MAFIDLYYNKHGIPYYKILKFKNQKKKVTASKVWSQLNDTILDQQYHRQPGLVSESNRKYDTAGICLRSSIGLWDFGCK